MPRPYGPLGLLASLVALAVLALLYTLAPLALAALAAVIAFGLAGAAKASSAVLLVMRRGDDASLTILFGLGILVYAATLAALYTLARWRAGADWRELVAWRPWSPRRAGWRFWALVGAGMVYGALAGAAVGWLHPNMNALVRFPQTPLGLTVSFALAVLAAPLAEEALFRGWIFTSLRARFSFWLTNIVCAAAFAIAHWDPTHLYSLAIFPLGLMLGLARERSGSIRASATFHALYNCFAFALVVFAARTGAPRPAS
ncbi:MAG TPA: type II CAAX endopeptidase family protein [Beijerinckiaceae bacterium]|nr:type II CAAX endopeptidase family protein [Beijerinckiaceae bacterium]